MTQTQSNESGAKSVTRPTGPAADQAANQVSYVEVPGGRIAHDLDAAAEALDEFWTQGVVAEANGSLFKVAKGLGSTEWHSHHDQDEVFVVTHGRLIIELRDWDVAVSPGQLFVVPTGVEHRPRADEETRFLIVGRPIRSTGPGGKPAWSHVGGKPA